MKTTIDRIKENPDYSLAFLKECFIYFRLLLTEEELISGQKHATGFGPNKFDFKKFLVDSHHLNRIDSEYKDKILDRWITKGLIFRYQKQLQPIIRKYEYLMSTRGV